MTVKRLPITVITLVMIFMTQLASGTEQTSKHWDFAVSLDGKPVGFHTFDLAETEFGQVLTTEASFDVKVLFVTAFRYRHKNTEIWQNDCLTSIDAKTNNNGKQLIVNGLEGDNQFQVENNDGVQTLSGCVKTFAYWRPELLGSKNMLNSQTGDYEDVMLTEEGVEQFELAGEAVEAVRYKLSAKKQDITLWYGADDNAWLGLEAPVRGGRILRYERRQADKNLDS